MQLERIILGIDPGTTLMGYGVIKQTHEQLHVLQYGVVSFTSYTTQALKLQKIFTYTLALINDFLPDEVALESPFYDKNVQSMLKLGRAQGVAMAAALVRTLPITEYTPRKVKQAVTGHGNASKTQVARMLMQSLQLPALPHYYDASDALAVAVCHSYQGSSVRTKPTSWTQFVQDHPLRVVELKKN